MIKEFEDKRGAEELERRFNELESEGRFDENINEIDWSGALKVDADFPYIPKGWLKFRYLLTNLFIVRPVQWYQTRIVYHLKVNGRENLKGIRSAIVTSNHVAIYDCLMNATALRPHRVKTIAAEFNNRRGRFGGWMRAGGMLPLSSNRAAMRKFSEAVAHYLSKGDMILVYPEQSMWTMYDKPRPFKTGAFHYAVKHNVPVIPMFITYRAQKKAGNPARELAWQERKYITVNILKPIYADKSLTTIDQAKQLAEEAYKACCTAYEQAYQTPAPKWN